ncbi:phosphatase PAP2 family protein [Candidatus Odyssella thessalonicensis]|uniref:phosphatase PAP2 family protein n=1 Tax=Candidatus Odyssella thessalonicensis TaxID=84647 RepID=UPI000225BB1D|nr:phosphatase PAP2 family protein [Candidatus Odyssella thessalonicensis]
MKKFLILSSLACSCYGKTTTASRMADIGQFINPALGLGLTVIKEDEAGLFQCLYSVVLNMAVTAGIKAGVNQIHKGDDPINKRPNGKPYNFPSGHTSSAAVGAAFIFLRYGIEYAALPFVITGITAAGRVQSHKHSEAGVMAGLMVGALSAFIFTKKFYEKNRSLTILPVTSKEFNGLKISYRF